jgi:hypothetical protein
MNNKVNLDSSIKCNICNKVYSSKSSLCNHNKKFHNNINTDVVISNHTVNINNHNVSLQQNNNNVQDQSCINKKYQCLYCNKIFNNRQNKHRHEKTCKNKLNESIQEKELELKLKKEENIRLKEEAKILKLKIKLQNSTKVDNITLKKLNKILLERSNRIKNSTVNSHNTQNNTQVINNYNLIGFGKENINETLTLKDKKQIINAKYQCLEKLIEIVHCGNYDQFKNIIITNMKDNYMYKYEENKGQFILSTKNEVMYSLVDYRMCDLEVMYNDLLLSNKINENTKNIIENFINRILNIDIKHEDCEGKIHENYKQYKINEIKLLLFNNQDKISNDISLFLSTNEVDQDIII